MRICSKCFFSTYSTRKSRLW